MKAIRIADLKANLSKHLRLVRRGHSLTVLDRETPVAEIIPYRTGPATLSVVRHKNGEATGRVPLPPPLKLERDVVELLFKERGDR